MTQETLKKANELEQKIRELKQAMNCFEYAPDIDHPEKVFSTSPILIIDFDDFDDGREQLKIPMELSNGLIDLLKTEIKKSLVNAEKEFDKL